MTRNQIKLSPWTVVDGFCATRIIEGADINDVASRIAFIEKTPRVRIAAFDADACVEQDSWLQGPKGNGGANGEDPANELYGFYGPSREWCDEQLTLMGYIL